MEQRVCGAAVKCGECFAADDAIDLDAEDFLYLFDAVDARRQHPIDNDICDGLILDLVGLPPIPILTFENLHPLLVRYDSQVVGINVAVAVVIASVQPPRCNRYSFVGCSAHIVGVVHISAFPR